jgi:hypothetical protein
VRPVSFVVGRSLRRAPQVKPGVVRIEGTPLQDEHQLTQPPARLPVGMLACGVICLLRALLLTWAYYAHILNDRSYWGSSDFLKLVSFSLPAYGTLVGGPIAMITAAWALRSGPSLKWVRIALVGSALSFGLSLLPLVLQAPDSEVQLVALVTGGASLYVLATTAWQASRNQDRRVA